MNRETGAYEPKFDDLAQLCALSRVNDFLLLGFQTGASLDWNAPFKSAEHQEYMGSVGFDRLQAWRGPQVSPEEYLSFFEALGFRRVEAAAFSPFFHEIVEVVEDPSCREGVVVEHEFWPGLRFGDLLFSRAGVRVRADSTVLRKEIAERSRLLFTFWRRRRETSDLSVGWGHNSQWGTELRRDYVEGDRFHYNMDGKYRLDDSYREQRWGDDPDAEPDDLTLEERIELLTYRCFVRTAKDGIDYCPYDDRYSAPVE